MRVTVLHSFLVLASIAFLLVEQQTNAFVSCTLPTRHRRQPFVRPVLLTQRTGPASSSSFCLSVSNKRSLLRLYEKPDDDAKQTEQSDAAVLEQFVSARKRAKYRMRLFAWLNQPAVEVIFALAVLLSSLLVALSTLNDLPLVADVAIRDALLALNLLFAADFMARWYAAGQFKVLYLTKPLVVIDILVIWIPLFLDVVLPLLETAGLLTSGAGSFWYSLQNSAGLQNLLLLRVWRLRRVLTDIGTFRRFATALGVISNPALVRPYQLQLARVLLSIFTLLSVASGLIYSAEHDVNPGIDNYFEALYFGLTTLTTVGFGDVTPVTAQGKLVVSTSIIAGVAVIPAQTAKLVDALLEFQRDEQARSKRESSANRSSKSASSYKKKNVGTTPQSASARNNVTDGKGPRGIPIEVQPKEWYESVTKRKNDGGTVIRMDAARACSTCQATHHWSDAEFCWSCGSALLPSNAAEYDNT